MLWMLALVPNAQAIYAWNEFGEGGILAPTVGDQESKLEAVQKVFSSPERSLRV